MWIFKFLKSSENWKIVSKARKIKSGASETSKITRLLKMSISKKSISKNFQKLKIFFPVFENLWSSKIFFDSSKNVWFPWKRFFLLKKFAPYSAPTAS